MFLLDHNYNASKAMITVILFKRVYIKIAIFILVRL